MLSGLNEPGLETLRLSKESVEGKKVDGFHDTVAAMDYLGIESKQREDIFRIIAIIVHLGNIRFKQAFGNGCDVDVDRKGSPLAECALAKCTFDCNKRSFRLCECFRSRMWPDGTA